VDRPLPGPAVSVAVWVGRRPVRGGWLVVDGDGGRLVEGAGLGGGRLAGQVALPAVDVAVHAHAGGTGLVGAGGSDVPPQLGHVVAGAVVVAGPEAVAAERDRGARHPGPRRPAVGDHRWHAGRAEPGRHGQPAGGRITGRARQQYRRGRGGRRPAGGGAGGGR